MFRARKIDPLRGLLANHSAFVLPAAFTLLVTIFGQWWNPHSFDLDEGINLGKGALVAAGFRPYADMWDDQPPILTYILAVDQELFPWSVSAARVTILLFACLLLFSVFRVVERSAGTAAATTSVILLGAAPLMWRLSISVMIGLPAVALAMCACAIVYRQEKTGLIRGAVAGLVFALSLQTKLFTAAALPAFLAIAYLSGEDKERVDRIKMMVVALSATAFGFLAIAIVVGEPLLQQLISPHVAGGVRSAYSFFNSALRLAEYLIQQPFVLLAALLAVISPRRVAGLQKAWLIWIGCSVVVLLGHTPVRYHHVLLLLVPMACLGGDALSRFIHAGWPGWGAFARYKIHLAIILPVVFLGYSILLLRPLHVDRDANEGTRLLQYAQRDPWVATDEPFQAFKAKLLVSPELVVFSRKRIESNNLTPGTLIEVLAARRPGQVLLERFHVDRLVLEYLDKNYVRVDSSTVHHVRPDLAD